MKKRFGKKMIEVTDVENTEEVQEEETMEEKIGFFAKHKKGILIGAGAAVLAAAAGLIAAGKRDDDFEDFEDEDLDDVDTPSDEGSASAE